MSNEEKVESFFWFFTPLLFLIFTICTTLTLMEFLAGFVNWNAFFGHLTNWWTITITDPFENLLYPLSEWMGWPFELIPNYLLFGFFYYNSLLSLSLTQSKWNKGDMVSIAVTWPLGLLAWPGLLPLFIRTWFDNRDRRNFIALVNIPFLITLILLIANFLI